MSNLLNPDNAFFSFMNRVCNILWASVLWTVTSLGVVTMGTATTALYYTVVKVIRKERGYVTRSYFHSFKENIKQGIVLNIIFLLLTIILWVDIRYAIALGEDNSTFGTILTGVFVFLTVISLFIMVWVYPILSRFKAGLKQIIINALLISIRHFPTTIVMLAIYAGAGYAIYMYLPLQFLILVPFILPALISLIRSFLVERVLKKYTPTPDGSPEETGEDQWYLE